MRWLYWWLFDVEIMSDEQMQKVKRVISPSVVLGFSALIVVLCGLMVAFGNQSWYLFAAMIVVLVVFLIFFYQAKVSRLVDQNPSRYLPEESKTFKRVKRGMYLLEFLWFLTAIKIPELGWRTLWLGVLGILVVAWSLYQWRRLNHRLHIQK